METMTLKHTKIKEGESNDIASHTLFIEIPKKIGEVMGYHDGQEIPFIELDSLRAMKYGRSVDDTEYGDRVYAHLTV